MVDIGSIAAFGSSIKAMIDITRAMKDLNDATVVRAKVFELQELMLGAQQSAFSAQSERAVLLEELRELKAKLAKLENWEAQKLRYQLKDYGSGTFAYELRKENVQEEPPHRICAKCFEDGHRSILQFKDRSYLEQDIYHCPRCNTDVNLGTPRVPPSYDPPRGSGWPA